MYGWDTSFYNPWAPAIEPTSPAPLAAWPAAVENVAALNTPAPGGPVPSSPWAPTLEPVANTRAPFSPAETPVYDPFKAFGTSPTTATPKAKPGVLGESFGILKPDEQQAWLKGKLDEHATGTARIANLKKMIEAAPSPYARRALDLQLKAQEAALPDIAQLNKMQAGAAPLPTKTGLRTAVENIPKGFAESVLGVPEFAGIVKGYLSDHDVDDDNLVKWAQGAKKSVGEMFPGDPARAGDFEQQLANGLGQIGSFYGAGALASLAKAGPKVMAAIVSTMGAAQSGSQGFEEATTKLKAAQAAAKASGDEATVTELDRILQTGGYAAVGLTEAIPIVSTLGRAGQPASSLGRRMLSGAEGALEEGVQEAGSQVAQNVIAGQTTDPARSAGEGVIDSAGVGATLGGLMGAALPGTMRKPREPGVEEIDPFVEPPEYAGTPDQPLSFVDLIPDANGEYSMPGETVAAKQLPAPVTPEQPGSEAPASAVAAPVTPLAPSSAPGAATSASAPITPSAGGTFYDGQSYDAAARGPKRPGISPETAKTPAFQNWFKGSKIKDEAGQPIVMYHATHRADPEYFDTRRSSNLRKGAAWFAADPAFTEEYALREDPSRDPDTIPQEEKEYGGTYPVVLSIKNPLDIGNVERPISWNQWKQELPISQELKNELKGPKYVHPDSSSFPLYHLYGDSDSNIKDVLEKAGYDGVKGIEKGAVTYAAFSPGQVKSIYNKGDFDPENPNILGAAKPAKSEKPALPETPFKAQGDSRGPGDASRTLVLSPKLNTGQVKTQGKLLLSAGRTVAIDPSRTELVLNVVESMAEMIPEGTAVGVLTRVEPVAQTVKGKPIVRAFYATREGGERSFETTWDQLQELRAFYSDGGIFFLRLDAAETGRDRITGELWHELVHALRRQNLIPLSDWNRLVGHAEDLGTFDMDFKEFAKQTGDPMWADYDAGVTLREFYADTYKDRGDFGEVMTQESVAHTLELYSHNALAGQDVDAIQDILTNIAEGKYNTAQPGAETQGNIERLPNEVGDDSTAQRSSGTGASAGKAASAARAGQGAGESGRSLAAKPKPRERQIVKVYHGTVAPDFATFDDSQSRHGDWYFTDRPGLANEFAGGADPYFLENPGSSRRKDSAPRVIPADLDVSGFKTVNMAGKILGKPYEYTRDEGGRLALEIAQAKAEGHRGLIAKGVTDMGVRGDQYITWTPNTVTSSLTGDTMYAMKPFSKKSPEEKLADPELITSENGKTTFTASFIHNAMDTPAEALGMSLFGKALNHPEAGDFATNPEGFDQVYTKLLGEEVLKKQQDAKVLDYAWLLKTALYERLNAHDMAEIEAKQAKIKSVATKIKEAIVGPSKDPVVPTTPEDELVTFIAANLPNDKAWDIASTALNVMAKEPHWAHLGERMWSSKKFKGTFALVLDDKAEALDSVPGYGEAAIQLFNLAAKIHLAVGSDANLTRDEVAAKKLELNDAMDKAKLSGPEAAALEKILEQLEKKFKADYPDYGWAGIAKSATFKKALWDALTKAGPNLPPAIANKFYEIADTLSLDGDELVGSSVKPAKPTAPEKSVGIKTETQPVIKTFADINDAMNYAYKNSSDAHFYAKDALQSVIDTFGADSATKQETPEFKKAFANKLTTYFSAGTENGKLMQAMKDGLIAGLPKLPQDWTTDEISSVTSWGSAKYISLTKALEAVPSNDTLQIIDSIIGDNKDLLAPDKKIAVIWTAVQKGKAYVKATGGPGVKKIGQELLDFAGSLLPGSAEVTVPKPTGWVDKNNKPTAAPPGWTDKDNKPAAIEPFPSIGDALLYADKADPEVKSTMLATYDKTEAEGMMPGGMFDKYWAKSIKDVVTANEAAFGGNNAQLLKEIANAIYAKTFDKDEMKPGAKPAAPPASKASSMVNQVPVDLLNTLSGTAATAGWDAYNATASKEDQATAWMIAAQDLKDKGNDYSAGKLEAIAQKLSPGAVAPPPVKKPIVKLPPVPGLTFDDLTPAPAGPFTYTRPLAGGTYPKEIWTDAQGKEYLFKPVKREQAFMAYAEAAGGHIARLVNPDAPRMWVQELNDRVGSMQEMVPNKGMLAVSDINEMSKEDIYALQREHVVDWLISNHDAHVKQFLRGPNGEIIGIDKGQSFKHFGRDHLSKDYHPNNPGGNFNVPIYNYLWQAFSKGELKRFTKEVRGKDAARIDQLKAGIKQLRATAKNLDDARAALKAQFVKEKQERASARAKLFAGHKVPSWISAELSADINGSWEDLKQALGLPDTKKHVHDLIMEAKKHPEYMELLHTGPLIMTEALEELSEDLPGGSDEDVQLIKEFLYSFNPEMKFDDVVDLVKKEFVDTGLIDQYSVNNLANNLSTFVIESTLNDLIQSAKFKDISQKSFMQVFHEKKFQNQDLLMQLHEGLAARFPSADGVTQAEFDKMKTDAEQARVDAGLLEQELQMVGADFGQAAFAGANEAINVLQNKLKDSDFLTLIRPYAESRFGDRVASFNAFMDYALQRKQGLGNKFHRFFISLSNDRDRAKKAMASLGQSFGPTDRSGLTYNTSALKYGLSPLEFGAITRYTGSMFRPVNRTLREQNAFTGDQINPNWVTSAEFARVLDSALAKLPPYIGTVNRGLTTNDPATINMLVPGKIFHSPQFLSTSKSSGFDGTIKFTIQSATGRDVSSMSSHSAEAEVLFPSGSEFLITDVKKTGTGFSAEYKVTMVELPHIDFDKLEKLLNP